MVHTLLIMIHTLVEILRKLWQRLTGRVPVPVRVRRFSPLDRGDSFSRSSVIGPFRPVVDDFRHPRF